MFFDGNSKRLPSLSAYVAKVASEPPKPSLGGLWFTLGVAGAAGLFAATTALMGPLVGILATAVVGAPALILGLSALDRWITRPRNAHDIRRHEVYQAALVYNAAGQRRKLHKELDPVAAQLLEACAHFHARVMVALEGPFWQAAAAGSHWGAIADQSRKAADDAMQEALILCLNCIGKPDKTRGGDIKEALEDFLELDFVDALQNLKGVATADSTSYSYRSPHLPVVFQPVKEIAERLKKLAIEVERLSQEAARETVASGGYAASASIDLVLNEIQAIERAESELDNPPEEHQHQRA